MDIYQIAFDINKNLDPINQLGSFNTGVIAVQRSKQEILDEYWYNKKASNY
ncbi:hypothetical protein [Acinetobacter defluvii]|uniref:hypothetical protein n=1 Tax=Acinetobacter defluvii TaxID=1871111 RepID=UPI00148F2DB6|nr:hypothetical protein [Acinetobacter defluvii]